MYKRQICSICKKERLFPDDQHLCEECWIATNPLIKVDDHYVTINYRHHLDGSDQPHGHKHDEYASLPTVEWCTQRNKWKVLFHAPDFGGYEFFTCVWYYDSKEDIITEMMNND